MFNSPLIRSSGSILLKRGFFPESDATPRSGCNNPLRNNKVVALWNALLDRVQARHRILPPPIMFGKSVVVPNGTDVGCLDNEYVLRVDTGMRGTNGKPIHAHRISPQSPDSSTGNVVYAAGQSPPAESFTDFLAQSVASKQGLFEFVSRKAHHDADHTDAKSMIDLLKKEIAKPRVGDSPLMFGNRYAYQSLNQLAGKGYADNREKDFLRYELKVADLYDGSTVTVPLTQAGLKFSNKLLRPEEIRRASVLLDAHQDAVMSYGHAERTELPVQLILSRAGAGRNATLICYQKIARLIENRQVTAATLDLALEGEIDAGRIRRGSGYVHSIDQLASLRSALLDKVAAIPPREPPVAARLSRSTSMPEMLLRAVYCPQAQSTSAPSGVHTVAFSQHVVGDQPSGNSPVATAIPKQDIKDEAATNPPAMALPHSSSPDRNINSAAACVTEPFKKQQGGRIDQTAETVISKSCVAVTSLNVAEIVTTDGPSKPILPTTYTNNDIEMARADLLLSGPCNGQNTERKLFAEDGGSWWRAAFVSVLLEHAIESPNATGDAAGKIAQRVLSLGPEFADEAILMEQMMLQLTNIPINGTKSADIPAKGIRGFMTDLHPSMTRKAFSANRPLFVNGVSRLKAVGEEDNVPALKGETALKKVAQAMLLKGGFSQTTVTRLFDGDAMEEGTTAHIVELMNQLGAREGIILNRPWVYPDSNSSGEPTLDLTAITLDMYTMAHPLGEKTDDYDGVHPGDPTRSFIRSQHDKPVIVSAYGHFSILISASEVNDSRYKLYSELDV